MIASRTSGTESSVPLVSNAVLYAGKFFFIVRTMAPMALLSVGSPLPPKVI